LLRFKPDYLQTNLEPGTASLAKKLRRVWTQREAHNVTRAMAQKRERTLQKKK